MRLRSLYRKKLIGTWSARCFSLAVGVALLTAIGGCQNVEEQSGDLLLEDLPCAGVDAVTGVWESVSWPTQSSCAWNLFDHRVTLRVFHGLGRTPSTVLTYLSFLETGESAVLSAGDMSRIKSVDAASVVLQNRSKQHFFMRLVLY